MSAFEHFAAWLIGMVLVADVYSRIREQPPAAPQAVPAFTCARPDEMPLETFGHTERSTEVRFGDVRHIGARAPPAQSLNVRNGGSTIAFVDADGGVTIVEGHTCEEALQSIARSVSR